MSDAFKIQKLMELWNTLLKQPEEVFAIKITIYCYEACFQPAEILVWCHMPYRHRHNL